MENVFEFRDNLINEYSNFSRSFTRIQAQDIRELVESEYAAGRYWPEPLIQINPNYQRKESVQELVRQGLLHNSCADIFLEGKPDGKANPLHLFTHQLEAIANERDKKSYVVTTGTGSGKSLSFFIPIIDRILKAKELDPTPRTRAIVIYPMNALANSQLEELSKFLHGYLVAVVDWYSRYVLSFDISITLEADFCIDALQQALVRGTPEIFYSDQGSQFTSPRHTEILHLCGVRISMDSKGRALENIFVERLLRSVKYEEVYLHDYESVQQARDGIKRYFDYYNNERQHQSLGYRTPAEVYFKGVLEQTDLKNQAEN